MHLGNGELLKPKAFTCFYTISDLEYLRSRPSLEETFSVNKQDCYLLFFDHPPLKTGEEAVMNINDALALQGRRMNVPLIHLKKAVGAP